MAKNYYIILNVSPHATPRQIRTAYLQRAKELHPDHFGPDAQPFLDLQEAYSVLSDPRRRNAYDESINRLRVFRRPGFPPPEPLTTRKPFQQAPEPLEEAPLDLGEASLSRSFRTFGPSFDAIFDRLWSNFSRLSRSKGEMMESLAVEIPITPDQARRGGHVRITVPARAACPTCGGYGGVDVYECWRCSGEGAVSGEFPLLVSFPAGVSHDQVVRLPLDRFGIRNMYLTVYFRITEHGNY